MGWGRDQESLSFLAPSRPKEKARASEELQNGQMAARAAKRRTKKQMKQDTEAFLANNSGMDPLMVEYLIQQVKQRYGVYLSPAQILGLADFCGVRQYVRLIAEPPRLYSS